MAYTECGRSPCGTIGTRLYFHFTPAGAIADRFAVALVSGLFTVFFDVSYQSYVPVLPGRAVPAASSGLEISATLRTRIAR
jgi:hypothetical protein